MTKDDRKATDVHRIMFESKDFFCYEDFRYDRLADAVRNAKIETVGPRLEGGDS